MSFVENIALNAFRKLNCCEAVNNAIATYSTAVANQDAILSTALSAGTIGPIRITPEIRAALLNRFRELTQIIRVRLEAALRKILRQCPKEDCCEQAANALATVSVDALRLLVVAFTDPLLIAPETVALLEARIAEILQQLQSSYKFILSTICDKCGSCDKKKQDECSDKKSKIQKLQVQ